MVQFTMYWRILKCRGCDHVFVQTVYTDSESYNHYHDEYGDEQIDYDETINYWPALLKRAKPFWLNHISGKRGERVALKDALTALYGALDSDLRALAAIGIRTCFDVAAELLDIDTNLTFARKLDELVQAGHIAALDRSRLEALVDAGSASAHRGWRPSAEDVETMTDALEHFIHSAFVAPEEKKALDAKVAALKGNVPKRPKAKQKPKNSAGEGDTTPPA
uniref:DUF4145 domain-containing protein n=1 Tax=uncultured Sphingomonas sp. TaxID=158754 RepID=UPI0035CC8624